MITVMTLSGGSGTMFCSCKNGDCQDHSLISITTQNREVYQFQYSAGHQKMHLRTTKEEITRFWDNTKTKGIRVRHVIYIPSKNEVAHILRGKPPEIGIPPTIAIGRPPSAHQSMSSVVDMKPPTMTMRRSDEVSIDIGGSHDDEKAVSHKPLLKKTPTALGLDQDRMIQFITENNGKNLGNCAEVVAAVLEAGLTDARDRPLTTGCTLPLCACICCCHSPTSVSKLAFNIQKNTLAQLSEQGLLNGDLLGYAPNRISRTGKSQFDEFDLFDIDFDQLSYYQSDDNCCTSLIKIIWDTLSMCTFSTYSRAQSGGQDKQH